MRRSKAQNDVHKQFMHFEGSLLAAVRLVSCSDVSYREKVMKLSTWCKPCKNQNLGITFSGQSLKLHNIFAMMASDIAIVLMHLAHPLECTAVAFYSNLPLLQGGPQSLEENK